MQHSLLDRLRSRVLGLTLSALLLAPILAGCGGPAEDTRSGANMPPVDDTLGGGYQSTEARRSQETSRGGISAGKTMAVLAGAAALYYLYNKNKQKRAEGDTSQPQYYLSKNGRVYYRDRNGRAHWVTPPQGGIQVPMEEASRYRDFEGYNNQRRGRSLMDVIEQGGYEDAYERRGGY